MSISEKNKKDQQRDDRLSGRTHPTPRLAPASGTSTNDLRMFRVVDSYKFDRLGIGAFMQPDPVGGQLCSAHPPRNSRGEEVEMCVRQIRRSEPGRRA